MVTCTPFQNFKSCDASFNDFEGEKFKGFVDFPSFDEKHDGLNIGNIDDLFHIERYRWDISCFYFDGDPIYDTDDDYGIEIVLFESYE